MQNVGWMKHKLEETSTTSYMQMPPLMAESNED